MRRVGVPLLGPGLGGLGGSPLVNILMAGGLGYLFGSRVGQPPVQQVAQQAQAPAYPSQYLPSPPSPPSPPYQYPQYPAPSPAPSAAPAPAAPAASTDSNRLAQLKLLGELHAAGTLTDEEFEREKERILTRS
jgi:hypothetical protein